MNVKEQYVPVLDRRTGAPDPARESWTPIAVLGLGVFVIGTDMFIVAGFLGQLAGDPGVTVGVAALTVTVFAIAYAVGAPLLGAALSVRSPRRVLIGSLTAFVVCAAVSALAPAMVVLLAARVLGGLAASIFGPAAAAAAVAARPASRRGRALGIVQGASSIAMIAGAPLGLLLASALSWRASFGLVAVISAIAVIGLLLTGFTSPPPARFTVRERFRPIRSPAVVGSLGVTFLMMTASNSIFSYLSVLLGDGTGLGDRQGSGTGLHAAQVEEQLALRLCSGDLDQTPVAQDVFVHLSADPVQRERHEAHAAFRVEPANGLHEAHVPFLDQVGLRQSITHVVPGDGHYQPQVRQHQRPRGIDVVVLLEASPERGLLFLRQQREPVDRLDVVIEASQRSGGRKSQRGTGHAGVSFPRIPAGEPCRSHLRHPSDLLNISTRDFGVLIAHEVPE